MSCCDGLWLYAIVLLIVYKLLDRLIRIPYIGRYADRYILVTGCDTGFGNELAKRLDKLGCHVFAGCLTEKGETDLKKVCSERLKPIPLDVSKPESVRKAFDVVKSQLPQGKGLWGVVNNAGIVGPLGPAEWLAIDAYKQTMAVNFYGVVDVTMTFLPLVKQEHGRVVNMTSVFGRFSAPNCGSYCASKHALEAFTDNIRRSLIQFGCKVHIIEPGFYTTDLTAKTNLEQYIQQAWDHASEPVKQEFGEDYFRAVKIGSFGAISPHTHEVVDAYEHALLAYFPRVRYVVGKDAKFFYIPIQALPEWIGDAILARLNKDMPLPTALKLSP